MSKMDSQIYGIFGEDSSSDEAPKKKKSAPSSQPTMNLNKGYMNFVKSDKILYKPEANKVRVSFGKKKPQGEDQPSEDKMEIEPEKKKKSVKINEEKNEEKIFDRAKPVREMDDFISSEDERAIEDEEALIEAKINQEILKRKKKFDLKKATSNEAHFHGLPTILGKRRKGPSEVIQSTKSIEEENDEEEKQEMFGKGYKMMQALGYKVGKGLGSKEQGIVEPIQAVKKTVLDGRRVIKSTQGAKKTQASSLSAELLNDLEEEEMVGEVERPRLWKKGRVRNKMNFLRKTGHLKASDISLPESELVKPVIQQKVIDMRGPQAVYFEDYSAMKTLDHSKRATTTSYARPVIMNEMLLTLRGNIDKTKYNLQSSERRIKIEKDKIINYNYEKKQLEEEQQKIEKNVEGLKILKTKLNQFQNQVDKLDSQQILQLFKDCFLAAPEQFSNLNLDHLFINTILKKVQFEAQNWKITENSLEFSFDLFSSIKDFLIKILQFQEYLKFKSYSDTFTSQGNYDTHKLEKYLMTLFSQTWTQPVRAFILNDWNPKDPELLISLFEKWNSLVPVQITTQLYDTVLMPKLQQFVEEWSPISDKMPIHIRLHPWFPLLGSQRLEQLWKSIQLKISQLLQHWEPQDKSALILLKPWLRVFEQSSWENLIIRCILPKLLFALKDFEINPKKQKIEPLKWLLEWADYIPRDNLVSILENNVLRKIVEVGMEWVSIPEL